MDNTMAVHHFCWVDLLAILPELSGLKEVEDDRERIRIEEQDGAGEDKLPESIHAVLEPGWHGRITSS